MCKTEIFADVINIVSRETEIPVDRILSDHKDMETVDARYLLVRLLTERGLYPSQIADMMRKTRRAINYMITNFNSRLRCGKMMGIYLDKIRKSIGNK